MTLPSCAPLLLLLASPLLASCQNVQSTTTPPPIAAVLAAPASASCRAQVNEAVRELSGKALVLTDDAFSNSDTVVLTTVGQSAGGRMTRPSAMLRLSVGASGCQLTLDGQPDSPARVLVLAACSCRILPGR